LDTATRHLSFRAGALSFRLLNLAAALLSSRWLSLASKCKAVRRVSSVEPLVSLVITALVVIKSWTFLVTPFGRVLDWKCGIDLAKSLIRLKKVLFHIPFPKCVVARAALSWERRSSASAPFPVSTSTNSRRPQASLLPQTSERVRRANSD
jgi:hypothetical protein